MIFHWYEGYLVYQRVHSVYRTLRFSLQNVILWCQLGYKEGYVPLSIT